MGNWRSPSRRGRRSEGAPLAGGKRHLRTDERDMAKHLGLPVTQDRCCTSDVERLVWQGSLAAMGRMGRSRRRLSRADTAGVPITFDFAAG